MTNSFVDAELGIQATNPSVGDRALIAALEKHGEDEGEILARYEVLGRDARSPVVQYLVSMIMDDERRHHRIAGELANTIAWGGFDREQRVAKIPNLQGSQKDSAEFLAETRRLLAFEIKDRRELRRLRKDLRDYSDTTVWSLLVDTMILDTEKHMRVLKFLVHHLTVEPSAAPNSDG